MARLFVILGATLATGIGLGFAGLLGSSDAPFTIFGMEPVCVAAVEPCWLAFGGGNGVLVVGLAGIGLVSFTLYGAGLFFATGQLAGGLLAIGQAGVGLIGWIGQVGGGMTGIGQLIFGWLVRGQLPIGADGRAFHTVLLRQLRSTFAKPGSRYDLDPRTHA